VASLVQGCQERGLLTLSAGPNVLRLLPPLTVQQTDLDEAVDTIGEALGVGSN